MSKDWKRVALAAVAAVAIGWGGAVLAQNVPGNGNGNGNGHGNENGHGHGHGQGHPSHIRILLTATGGISVSNVGQNCGGTDTVDLSPDSMLHILANPKRGTVRVNADDVRGTGTLGTYHVNGSTLANLGGNAIPTDGTVAGTAQFKLRSEGHCASQLLPVTLGLTFSGGVLQSSSTACVTGTSGC